MIKDFLETEKEYPAVGLAFGLEVIMDAVKLKIKLEKKTVTQVYIIPIGTFEKSMKIAQKLRNADIKTDIDLSDKGPSKNLKFAGSLGIPYVIFIGEDELKKNKLKLRDMKTGKEKLLTAEEIIKILK